MKYIIIVMLLMVIVLLIYINSKLLVKVTVVYLAGYKAGVIEGKKMRLVNAAKIMKGNLN